VLALRQAVHRVPIESPDEVLFPLLHHLVHQRQQSLRRPPRETLIGARPKTAIRTDLSLPIGTARYGYYTFRIPLSGQESTRSSHSFPLSGAPIRAIACPSRSNRSVGQYCCASGYPGFTKTSDGLTPGTRRNTSSGSSSASPRDSEPELRVAPARKLRWNVQSIWIDDRESRRCDASIVPVLKQAARAFDIPLSVLAGVYVSELALDQPGYRIGALSIEGVGEAILVRVRGGLHGGMESNPVRTSTNG
jgi:hypothetical protein